MKYNLDDLKAEYINKVFGYLTVINVFRENSILYFTCKCKCGNTKNILKKSVLRGDTKSCGCFYKTEEFSNILKSRECNSPERVKERAEKYSLWCKNNPLKVKENGEKRSQFYKDHPEVVKQISDKNREWSKNNSDKVQDIAEQNKLLYKNKRINSDFSLIIPIVHKDDIQSLLDGGIRAQDNIRIKCPVCGCYDYHALHNFYRINENKLKYDSIPKCHICRQKEQVSKYEQEITEFILTIYNGSILNNVRNVIKNLELDIFIPDKKIAIEFNGDYWHNEHNKKQGYHISKYKKCRHLGILLVSIFESEWNKNKDSIKEYLRDLFNDKENKLSFNEDKSLMNNNYPSPLLLYNENSFIYDNYYVYGSKNIKVFTCGYSKIQD